MPKDWKLYLFHALECIDKIKIIQSRGDISSDFILYDALLRNLQTLSESTSYFPQEIKLQYAAIDWKGINGFRNILVHDYLGEIDAETVKRVVTDHLPALESVIRIILSNTQNNKTPH